MLGNSSIIKAVFLDRDGVILNDTGHYYISNPNDVIINQEVVTGLKKFQESGFLLIVVSNQSGIGKGMYSVIEADAVNLRMSELLQQSGILLNDILYCPHHPETSQCFCRKPGSILFEKAISKWKIDTMRSWMIGDQERDIKAAAGAGIKGIQLPSNTNFYKAVSNIISHA